MTFARRPGGSVRANAPGHADGDARDGAVALGLVVFAVALAIGLFVARPFGAAPIAFDTSASVLHFERIVSGRVLEEPLTTTPKPLLTVLYGPLHALTGDWRPISWLALAAGAAATALAALLARRLAGMPAAAFVAVTLAGSSTLVYDAARGLATPWAIAGWAAAGLAVTGPRPRYALAGLALMLATLARLETLLITALAVAFLAVADVAARRGRPALRRAPPRAAWLVSIGFLALPIMLVHDWLLARDPLFWLSISSIYSDLHPQPAGVAGLARVTEVIATSLAPIGGMVALAVVGVAAIVRRGHVAIAVGLVALTAGVAAFLFLLGARGLAVPVRYTAPIEAAVLFGAGLGFAALRLVLDDRPAAGAIGPAIGGATAHRSPVRLLGPAVAVIAAILLSAPFAPFDGDLIRTIRGQRLTHQHATALMPELRAIVRAAVATRPEAAPRLLIGPELLRPRLAVDLPLPLTELEGLDPDRVDLAAGYPAAGQVVLYDRRSSGPLPAFEVAAPTTVGPVVVEPVLVDRQRRVWVDRLLPR